MINKDFKGDKTSVLVIGGGIAGMQSALLLAEMGRKVFIVEQEPAIGGYFPLLDKTFPTNSCGVCFMSPSPPAFCPIHECRLHERIILLANSEVIGFEGEGGDFSITVRKNPRFVNPDKCTLCGACFEVCPVKTKNEFGGGLEERRAIYKPFSQAIPPSPVIDTLNCSRCGECLKVCCPGAIDLDMKETEEVLRAGSVILGFGFDPFPAEIKGEYGFGRYENVINGIQFERMLSTSSPSGGLPVRLSDGKKVRKIAFIQCVGSRDASCGREYCSTVCCMYATKQAMIAKERCPDLESTFFYMDIRPMGKDYEKYYERAKNTPGINYLRCAVSSIKELQGSKKLLITSVTEDGILKEDEYDEVILSVGFRPPRAVKELAGMIGVELDKYGFCRTGEFHPTRTSVPGIYVSGAFRSPKDIPETVVEGSGAAAEVASYLVLQPPVEKIKEYPAEGALVDDEPRIGIFICSCGQELSKSLDLDELVNGGKSWKDVAHRELIDLACLPEGLDLIKRRIGEHGLNRIVMAGCTPQEIRATVEDMMREIGLNRMLVEYANIREQCAFVHGNRQKQATRKALSLINMSVERARRIKPAQASRRKVSKKVLVIGAGLAGMTASLSLAGQGFEVFLVEKEDEIGGNLKESFFTMRGSEPQALLKGQKRRIEENDLIKLYTRAEVINFKGNEGNFRTTIRYGKEERKLEHGALIVATGGLEIPPSAFLYGKDDRVITQRQMEKLIYKNDARLSDLKSMVMIQCVGSRDEEHPYCSRICCGQTVKNAVRLKAINPSLNIYVLYRDVRTYGLNEQYYQEAREKGVIFIRYDPENKPEITSMETALKVSLVDPAAGRKVSIYADCIILSTGIQPRENDKLAGVLGVELNDDGFFMEANPKSAPLDAVKRGIYFCGLCHSPNYMEDSLSQGNAAAGRAAALLSRKEIEETNFPAFMVDRLCSGCGLCITACPYEARFLNEEGKAQVEIILCQGCGTCTVSCRNGASRQLNYDKEITLAVVDAAIE